MDKKKKEFKEERRRYKRVCKSFILSYYRLEDQHKKQEITQMKNIGMGGMCFIATEAIEPSTKLGIALKTPYIAETTHLEGFVLGDQEKVKGMLYETRIQFGMLNAEAEYLLGKLIEYFLDEERSENHE